MTLATMIAARERDLSGISPEPAAEDAVAPIPRLPEARAPVNLDEAIRAACDGVAGITPAQLRSLLSPEDIDDIEAGGIHPKILTAYALSFANHGGAGEANNTRHLLTAVLASTDGEARRRGAGGAVRRCRGAPWPRALVEQSKIYPLNGKGSTKPMTFPDASGVPANMLPVSDGSAFDQLKQLVDSESADRRHRAPAR